jgi:hypothetical protein
VEEGAMSRQDQPLRDVSIRSATVTSEDAWSARCTLVYRLSEPVGPDWIGQFNAAFRGQPATAGEQPQISGDTISVSILIDRANESTLSQIKQNLETAIRAVNEAVRDRRDMVRQKAEQQAQRAKQSQASIQGILDEQFKKE